MHSRLLSLTTAAVCLAGSLAAHAAPVSFNLFYSGQAFDNGATAIGFVTFDDAVLPNDLPGLANVPPGALGVLDFSITVSGASVGNGTFGLADFTSEPDGWIWILGGPLDLTAELVGQANFLDFNWCAGSFACGNADAPGGSGPFTITTAGELGDSLLLESMTVVPVPAAAWLFLSALGVLGWRTKARA